MDFIKEALTLGFNNAAVIDVKDLVFVLEYRQFCEENLCGNFNVISSCPPACGTPEEMHRKALNYKKALILQTVLESPEEQFDVKKAKYNHSILTEKFYIFFEEKGIYLGDDFVKPIFDYLLNNGSIVDTLELLYTS